MPFAYDDAKVRKQFKTKNIKKDILKHFPDAERINMWKIYINLKGYCWFTSSELKMHLRYDQF